MRYTFVQQHSAETATDRFPVRLMCRVLEVRPSGYYIWQQRQASQQKLAKEADRLQLLESIRLVHQRSRRAYGSPRVHQALKKQGIAVSRKRVARLMRQEQIRSSRQRRFRVRTTDSTHGKPVAQNLLDRRFEQPAPDQAWATDITYVGTDEGWLYVASVMDLCSRRIVGFATADHLKSELAAEALEAAIRLRRPVEGLLHHSDRGVQYASEDYQALLERHGIRCSMSRRGDCYDNAAKESFFKTFKVELVYQQHYRTRQEAKESIYQYIELFYNRQRLHSSLGYRSPVEFETQFQGSWG